MRSHLVFRLVVAAAFAALFALSGKAPAPPDEVRTTLASGTAAR